MILEELVTEFAGPRAPGWLVLDVGEIMACGIEATRFYAAYGDIASISLSDKLPCAPAPGSTTAPAMPNPLLDSDPALPIKDLTYIDEDTDLSTGEWAIVRPLFVLYVERENAQRLEASRAAGLELYGRSVAEITSDIERAEEALPQKAFSFDVIEIV